MYKKHSQFIASSFLLLTLILLLLLYCLLLILPECIEWLESSLKQLLDNWLIWGDKALLGKLILRVLEQFSESYAETPWMGFMYLQSFDQDSGNLLLNGFIIVWEEIDNDPRVEVSVAINVSQLIYQGV